MKKESNYVASVGKDDVERLQIQHEIFAPGTREFLIKAGLKQGMRVLVVGCGAGDETVMIAKIITNSGSVVGIDISAEQITVASQRIQKEGLQNVELKEISADNLDNNDYVNSFDFVCCRMLLVHLNNRQSILEKMLRCVKVNGILACEEPNVSTCYSEPSSVALNQHIQLLCKFIESKGGDPDYGEKLSKDIKKINKIDNLLSTFFQPTIVDKHLKQAALLSAKSCEPQYISSGLAKKEELQKIIQGIENDLIEKQEAKLVQCKMYQVATIRNCQ